MIGLKSTDVDSQRMVLRVEQGKGHKDRYAMLPPVLLQRLRAWWRYAKPHGLVRDGGWLFPGRNPINPIGSRMLNRAVHEAARSAGIDKRVSMHTLRHYVARFTATEYFRALSRFRDDIVWAPSISPVRGEGVRREVHRQ